MNKSNEKQKNNQIVSYFSQTHMCISKYMGLRLGVGVENAIRHFGDVVADSNVPIPPGGLGDHLQKDHSVRCHHFFNT